MFHVLHSSAGAGKTHALVKHYLEHCLTGADHGAYRQVLALTFTNKAAAEMKERVIGYLEKLAARELSEGNIRDVADHLLLKANVDEAALAARADAVLGDMLHHWSDVAISTIDSFTRRVVQPFARDLRLDHELQMTTEVQYYQDRAVDALIDAAGTDERINELLTDACMQLLHEERSWDPARPLKELSKELQKENAIGPLEKLRSFSAEQRVPLMARLRREEYEFRQRVHAIGAKARALFKAQNITEGDVAHGKGGIFGYFRKLSEFKDEWGAPGVQTLKPLETGKWASGKADPGTVAALNAISGTLTDLFHEAEGLREGPLQNYFVQRAVARELLPSFALHELDATLEALKKEDRVAFFSDLTRRVAEVVKDEPVPFIYERLGERYRHFLIDEFQDTSLLQWKALLPLIENALSTGGSTLIVGDAKQAIYRFRNGEVRLFVDLPQVFDRGDDPAEVQREATLVRNFKEGEQLALNRRSAKRIITFNNALFEALIPSLPEDLQRVYHGQAQQFAREENGLVELVRAEAGLKGVAAKEAMLDHAQACLERALADGFRPGDVAVLTRNKNSGREVADRFLALGHAVISPDGLQLGADPGIQLLIDLLRFIHAGEATAAMRVLQWQAILRDPGQPAQVFDQHTSIPDPVAHVRAWLKKHGSPRLRTTVAALVSELARANALRPAEDAAVLTLLDEVHNWTTNHAQDIGGFLLHWERKGSDRSTAPPGQGQAIQIMTVHKAKGLQFPVVIVPNTQMSGGMNHGELFWIHPGDAVPELDIALVRDSKLVRNAQLPEFVEEEGLRILDPMNLLYVAFTRAEQRLYAYVTDGGDVVNKALIGFMEAHPELAVNADKPEGPRKVNAVDTPELLVDVSSSKPVPELTIRFEAPEDWDPAEPTTHRQFGTSVHALIAATRTVDDLERSIQRALAVGDLSTEEAGFLRLELLPKLAAPELAPWFAPHLDVRAEAALITADGRSVRPDRLVIDGDRVRVLEIKTGKPSAAHADQVRSYMDLLRELGYSDVDGAVWYLQNGHLEPVS